MADKNIYFRKYKMGSIGFTCGVVYCKHKFDGGSGKSLELHIRILKQWIGVTIIWDYENDK